MGLLSSFSNVIKERLDKSKEEKEIQERIQKEAQMHRLQVFEKELRSNSIKVVEAQAKKDAAEKSGLQKLRAVNRTRNLQNNEIAPGSFFSKLSEYTQKNLAKREENLKKTEILRNTAKKMKEDKLSEQKKLREERMGGNKPFGESTWKK